MYDPESLEAGSTTAQEGGSNRRALLEAAKARRAARRAETGYTADASSDPAAQHSVDVEHRKAPPQSRRQQVPVTEEVDQHSNAPDNRRALLESIKSKRAQRQHNDGHADAFSSREMGGSGCLEQDAIAEAETGERRTNVQRRLDRIKLSRADREEDRQHLTCAEGEPLVERGEHDGQSHAWRHVVQPPEVVSDLLSKPLCHKVQEVQAPEPRPLDEERKRQLRGEDPRPTVLTSFILDEEAMDQAMLQKFETSLVGSRSLQRRIVPLEVGSVDPHLAPRHIEMPTTPPPPAPDSIIHEIDEEEAKDRAFLEKLMNPTQKLVAATDFEATQSLGDELEEEERKDLELLRKLDGSIDRSEKISSESVQPTKDSTSLVGATDIQAAAATAQVLPVTATAAVPFQILSSEEPVAATGAEEDVCAEKPVAPLAQLAPKLPDEAATDVHVAPPGMAPSTSEQITEGAAATGESSFDEHVDHDVAPILPEKITLATEAHKAYQPGIAPTVAQQNAERAAALGGSSSIFILGAQDNGPAIPPRADSIGASSSESHPIDATDAVPTSERRTLLEATKARRAARRAEGGASADYMDKGNDNGCPVADGPDPSASIAKEEGERSAAKERLDRIRSNRTEREHDRALLAKLEERENSADAEDYRKWKAAAEAKVQEPTKENPASSLPVFGAADQEAEEGKESLEEHAQEHSNFEDDAGLDGDDDDVDAPVEPVAAFAPPSPASVPVPSPELLTSATPRAMPRDIRPAPILTDHEVAESQGEGTAFAGEMTVAQSNRKAVMEQMKLKRAAREREGIDYGEDHSAVPTQPSEQRSRSEVMEQMKLKRAARKHECDNQATMQKSPVETAESPKGIMPRHGLQSDSSSRPAKAFDPPAQKIAEENAGRTIAKHEEKLEQSTVQAEGATSARKPPVNASQGPLGGVAQGPLGQAALPTQFGSFTAVAPKNPQIAQPTMLRRPSSGSAPDTPRSRLARIRELQAQRGLTPTFKADESDRICVVSDEYYTVAAKPIGDVTETAGVISGNSANLRHARSEPAEEPEPPAPAPQLGDEKIKSLRIEKVVMVNEHYGEDELLPGRFSTSPKAQATPKIAEPSGESFDTVLQDMKLKWSRYKLPERRQNDDAKSIEAASPTTQEEATQEAANSAQINFQLTPRHVGQGSSSSVIKVLKNLDEASEIEAVWREAEIPVGAQASGSLPLLNSPTQKASPVLSSPRKASPRKEGSAYKDSVVPLPPLNSTSGPISKSLGCVGGAEFLATKGKRQQDCAQM
eukprot:gnl/MRDRNA2_/MRDRNA2_72657_c0_seq2.p1 gnl/MRDRNA2_/MRDRNA2_72657_c0~~gnl/MRDRNA2_/MRDRNA2_72657_c0_seq2.p1  ORF type:complete len:1287 (-),score=359.69 gnl/MRDRNA2_/MRDRNA2_72657_c0_seq2:47-3871(-)